MLHFFGSSEIGERFALLLAPLFILGLPITPQILLQPTYLPRTGLCGCEKLTWTDNRLPCQAGNVMCGRADGGSKAGFYTTYTIPSMGHMKEDVFERGRLFKIGPLKRKEATVNARQASPLPALVYHHASLGPSVPLSPARHSWPR